MDDFNKRSADIFGALDTLKALPEKPEANVTSPGDDKFKRPRGVYTPPAKRLRTSSGPDEINHSTQEIDTPNGIKPPQHSIPRHHAKSCEPRRQSHDKPQKDLSKWTKYDLKDDGTEQLSGLSAEKINRTVAYQFLDQLKQRNQPEKDDPQDVGNKKVVFKKPTRSKGANSDTVKNPAAGLQDETEGSKEQKSNGSMVGGEGAKKTTSNKKDSGCGVTSGIRTGKQPKVRTKPSIVLSHLDECED